MSDLNKKSGLTSNMIANMGKGKHINMTTLARICETLGCGITDVIELVEDAPATDGGENHDTVKKENKRKRN